MSSFESRDDALRLEAQLFIKQICWVTLIRRCSVREQSSMFLSLQQPYYSRRPKGVSLLKDEEDVDTILKAIRVRIDLLEETTRKTRRCFFLVSSSLAFEKQNRKCLIRNPCPCSSIQKAEMDDVVDDDSVSKSFAISHCLKIIQNVAFEFFNLAFYTDFLSYQK